MIIICTIIATLWLIRIGTQFMAKKTLIFIGIAVILIILLALGFWHSSKNNMKITGSENLYQKQADKICMMLNQALSLYQKKAIKKAYETAENAYWNVYDNVLEIKYRSYATPAYIFSVESEFHATSTLMTAPVTDKKIQAIKTKVKWLCAEVNKEAAYLNKHN